MTLQIKRQDIQQLYGMLLSNSTRNTIPFQIPAKDGKGFVLYEVEPGKAGAWLNAHKDQNVYFFRQEYAEVHTPCISYSDITAVNTISLDQDAKNGEVWTDPLVEPTMIVKTSVVTPSNEKLDSHQTHFALTEPMDKDSAEKLGRAMARHHGYDESMASVRQIARAPGSYHQRGDGDGGQYRVEVVGGHGHQVSKADLIRAYQASLAIINAEEAQAAAEQKRLSDAHRANRAAKRAAGIEDGQDVQTINLNMMQYIRDVIHNAPHKQKAVYLTARNCAAICREYEIDDTYDVVLECIADSAYSSNPENSRDEYMRQATRGMAKGERDAALDAFCLKLVDGWLYKEIPYAEETTEEELLDIISVYDMEDAAIRARELAVLHFMRKQGIAVLRSTGKPVKCTSEEEWTYQTIDDYFGDKLHYHQWSAPNAKGECHVVRRPPSYAMRKNRSGQRFEVEGIISEPIDRDGYWNNYRDKRITPIPATTKFESAFNAYQTWCIPNPAERQALNDWMSFVFKYPGIKNQHYVELFSSINRTGKSWHMYALVEIMGDDSHISLDLLKGGWNDELYRTTLAYVDEMPIAHRDDGSAVFEELLKKHFHTKDSRCNPKYGKPSTQRTYSNLMWTTNKRVFDYTQLSGRVLRVNFRDNEPNEPADIAARIAHMKSYFTDWTETEVYGMMADILNRNDISNEPRESPITTSARTETAVDSDIIDFAYTMTVSNTTGTALRALDIKDRVRFNKTTKDALIRYIETEMTRYWVCKTFPNGRKVFTRTNVPLNDTL